MSTSEVLPNPDESLLSVKDVAARLNLKERTVYQHVKSGVIPFMFRIGGTLRARPRDVSQFIEDCCSDASF